MSKNITIKKDGVVKNFNGVNEIKTSKVGGGTQDFELASNIKLASVVVRKNGTYRAARLGLDGISSVYVNRPSEGPPCNIAMIDDAEDIDPADVSILEGDVARIFNVKRIKVKLQSGGYCKWVPKTSERYGTKYITRNGTYKAKRDGYLGYSSITVSVSDPEHPYTPDDPYVPDPYTPGPGPEPGPTPAIAPDHIEITTAPDKLAYTIGETIDYDGMVVKMFNADGTIFTDANHSDGVLKFSELTLSMYKAPDEDIDLYTDVTGKVKARKILFTVESVSPYYTSSDYSYVWISTDISNLDDPPQYLGFGWYDTNTEGDYGDFTSFYAYVTRYNNYFFGYGIDLQTGRNYFTTTWSKSSGEYEYGWRSASNYKLGNNEWTSVTFYEGYNYIPNSEIDPTNAGDLSYAANDIPVPVKWESTYGTTYEDSFSISVSRT